MSLDVYLPIVMMALMAFHFTLVPGQTGQKSPSTEGSGDLPSGYRSIFLVPGWYPKS
jgi:hypothetical protein